MNMRNATLFEATHRETTGPLGWLRRILTNTSIRNDLRLLQRLDDNQMSDIGLTRMDIDRLIRLSNAVDLRHEVEAIWLRQSDYPRRK
jgi:uncharacterized protein YjiS (DUF1127 family)